MTDEDPPAARIPVDTFGARLALVRQASGGLNMTAAARRCGLNESTWHNWEAGISLPRDYLAVCGRIAGALGFDFAWLALGGPLAASSTKWYAVAAAA
jgi:transcriptional regulator with XRE-family HTH domain